jgi:hypothetical protein
MKLYIHRQHPPLRVLEDNVFVGHIRQMRDIDGTTRPDGLPYAGSIEHALETIRDFDYSASSWTQEHLARFQAIVLEARQNELLFPIEYAVPLEDKALTKIEVDGFLQANKTRYFQGSMGQYKAISQLFFFFWICYISFAVLERHPLARRLKFETSPGSLLKKVPKLHWHNP